MTVDEKRLHFRKSLQAEASIADVLGNTWTAINFLDISRTGVAFISQVALAPGSSRMVRFYLPNNPKRIDAICKIVHCTEHAYLSGYRVGAEFARIHSDDVDLVDGFVAQTNTAAT
jgi:c-di-GMP-binding flagellar brake protein YcgR